MFVILVVSSQIMYDYKFVNETEKASTFETKRNENPVGKKTAGMFGG